MDQRVEYAHKLLEAHDGPRCGKACANSHEYEIDSCRRPMGHKYSCSPVSDQPSWSLVRDLIEAYYNK